MARFIIQGQRSLSGVFTPAGNKNAALPMLAACLLTDQPLVLQNVPLIQDVFTMCELLSSMGVDIQSKGHQVTLHAPNLKSRKLDKELCHQVRSSILFAGAMASRGRQITLHPPGGDVIGRRRLDTHFAALKALGIEIDVKENHYLFHPKKLRGTSLLLDEASVTATENVMLASVLASGTTTILNAACEPHVQDLGTLLNKMGARISGLGTNCIKIEGVKALRGATHKIRPDHTETGSLIIASALTGGNIVINQIEEETYRPMIRPFQTLGIKLKLVSGTLNIQTGKHLRIKNDIASAIPVIDDGPWPNFPSDLMSVAIVAGTQARGTVLFFEKMFESRMYFVDNLIRMGARIVQCDPHRILVTGPSALKAIPVTGPDIRAGMAMLIAALCARGTSTIDNAEVIDRGYENIDKQLRKLGADIRREKK